jgi:hypothetical protein
MTCLTNPRIQAVADGESSSAEHEHVASCAGCTERVAMRRAQTASLAELSNGIEMPAESALRIEHSLASNRGATRLRVPDQRRRWHPPVWGTGGLVAATLAAVLFVAPMLKQDGGTVSAAEVLAHSASRLSQTVASGVEVLMYELVLDGVPKAMAVDHANGTYRVWQAIDHDHPGRFRFASTAVDGTPISSIAQDPASGRRTLFLNLEGQPFRFNVTIPAEQGISLPELERLHMEASIAMMQASGNQMLEVIDTPDGRKYRIAVPHVTAPVSSPVWDLTEARVLIYADDYRVSEFSVKGTFLKQQYSVSYRLLSRSIVDKMEEGVFDVPEVPGEIVISGEGSAVPARDAMVLALRELARAKQKRE